ncbi:MAG TPA: hypothetical protein VKE72_01865 [Methylocella sp.]|nr:hypothetical protein [Methylocella sp.]
MASLFASAMMLYYPPGHARAPADPPQSMASGLIKRSAKECAAQADFYFWQLSF